uniref:Uncharacterized protein n=1 Tax=Rhizophora mucronata TaxID=61149 RepID=A0A2P2QPQ6_RHIMU
MNPYEPWHQNRFPKIPSTSQVNSYQEEISLAELDASKAVNETCTLFGK